MKMILCAIHILFSKVKPWLSSRLPKKESELKKQERSKKRGKNVKKGNEMEM